MPLPSIADKLKDERSFAFELLRKMFITKTVRFEASRRLEKMHATSRLATSMLSFYVICITVIELLFKQRGHTDNLLLPLATIAAPVFILIIEAHEADKRYLVKADHMHRSAQTIHRLHSGLELMIVEAKLSLETMIRFNNEYQEILREFPQHHENVDYFYSRWLYREEFAESSVGRLATFMRGPILRLVYVWLLPSLLIAAPGTLIGFAITALLGLPAK